MTTSELLEAWRETSRAAELAERLAQVAGEVAERADVGAEAADEVAALAERAAVAAIAAADRARQAADDLRRIASEERAGRLHAADQERVDTRVAEDKARDAYHQGADEARTRNSRTDPG